jgi:hypothetical protein
MSTVSCILMSLIVVLLMLYILWPQINTQSQSTAENFGPCDNCPTLPEYNIYSINPYRWPYSGSQYRSQWQYSPNGQKPPNTTDAAEALPAPNPSGMNVLTVPDEEYKTN